MAFPVVWAWIASLRLKPEQLLQPKAVVVQAHGWVVLLEAIVLPYPLAIGVPCLLDLGVLLLRLVFVRFRSLTLAPTTVVSFPVVVALHSQGPMSVVVFLVGLVAPIE